MKVSVRFQDFHLRSHHRWAVVDKWRKSVKNMLLWGALAKVKFCHPKEIALRNLHHASCHPHWQEITL